MIRLLMKSQTPSWAEANGCWGQGG